MSPFLHASFCATVFLIASIDGGRLSKIKALRADMEKGDAALRADMEDETEALRADMENHKKVLSGVNEGQADLESLNNRLEILENLNGVHCLNDTFQTLDEPWRDVNEGSRHKCDSGLEGWYRFQRNSANAVMPTSCVNRIVNMAKRKKLEPEATSCTVTDLTAPALAQPELTAPLLAQPELTAPALVQLEPEVEPAASGWEDIPQRQTQFLQHRAVQARPYRIRSKGISVKPQTRTVSCQTEEAPGLSLLCPSSPLSRPDPESDSEDDGDTDDNEDTDSDFDPVDEDLCPIDTMDECEPEEPALRAEPASPTKDRKYIVFQSSLLELFSCPHCQGGGRAALNENGTQLQVSFFCPGCKYSKEWSSQPYVNKMPAGNLMLSASILFSGSLLCKTFQMMDIFNIARIGQTSFYRHQREYLQPTVLNMWLEEQDQLLRTLADMEGGLVLAGDGRSDSPGHCAKYGGFNTIECRINKVIDVQVVQSNEAGNSARSENEGLRKTLTFLAERGCKVDVMITDRHKLNEKYLRENWQQIMHWFDIWHVGKGLGKKLTKLGAKPGMEAVTQWQKAIINHLHWVAASTQDGNPDVMLAKWDSLLNHIANKHRHNSAFYHRCEHRRLPLDRNKDWMEKDSPAYLALLPLLESKYLRKDIQKLSPQYQTSALESFHSLILQFCPKRIAFSNLGMQCRLAITAMHYNENSERKDLQDEDGNTKLRVIFPKAKKGDYSVRKVKENATHEYASNLMERLFVDYGADPAELRTSLPERYQDLHDDLAADFHHPTKEEARQTYTTRYGI